MKVLFRTDGGAGIGLGHLQRCLSLAEALRRAGATPLFMVSGDDAAAQRARSAGFGAEPAPDAGAEATAGAAKRGGCPCVVVDSYLVDGEFLSALRGHGLFVAAIDDLNEYPFPCQMVVSFGPHAPSAGYQSSSGDTRFLLGPAYTLLRPEYWEAPRPARNDTVRNVLVTTGGADPQGLMPSWLETLDRLDSQFSVTAVVGPFFTDPGAVHDTAAACARTVRVIDAPPMLRPLLARADVVVTAAGQTLYECAALGLPTVAAEIAPNQRPQLEGFAAAGAMISAGRASDPGAADRIASAVARLCAEPAGRARLADAATALVDPRGALTVAAQILRGAGPMIGQA